MHLSAFAPAPAPRCVVIWVDEDHHDDQLQTRSVKVQLYVQVNAILAILSGRDALVSVRSLFVLLSIYGFPGT